MKGQNMKSSYLILASIILLTFATPAMAYIDPGSGSAIMSAIVGFFAAITMLVKTYWYKLKSLFSSRENEQDVDTTADDPAENG